MFDKRINVPTTDKLQSIAEIPPFVGQVDWMTLVALIAFIESTQ